MFLCSFFLSFHGVSTVNALFLFQFGNKNACSILVELIGTMLEGTLTALVVTLCCKYCPRGVKKKTRGVKKSSHFYFILKVCRVRIM